jgi:hypothetical protein
MTEGFQATRTPKCLTHYELQASSGLRGEQLRTIHFAFGRHNTLQLWDVYAEARERYRRRGAVRRKG